MKGNRYVIKVSTPCTIPVDGTLFEDKIQVHGLTALVICAPCRMLIMNNDQSQFHCNYHVIILYCSQIHSPLLGDLVDSCIGLSYRPAILAGRYDSPMSESNLSRQTGTMNFAPIRDFSKYTFKEVNNFIEVQETYKAVYIYKICENTGSHKN